MRNFELPGRSPVHSSEGMAAASQPLAAQTAIDVLKAGGNAIDAAIAACAVQCVVEPGSTGIGGDCFCLYSPGGEAKNPGDIVAYNGSGRAPAAASVEWYRGQGIDAIAGDSVHSVTIPGAIDAWDRLVADHGRKSLPELLQPAIRHAREGYPISSRVQVDFASQAVKLGRDENAARIFLPGGAAPRVGALHRQPDLAATLERIAAHGRDEFYSGETARDIVACLRQRGGLHTLEDFASHQGEYVTPISAEFRGHTIHQCPPNGQGVIALLLLNIMSGVEAGAAKGGNPITLERIHAEIEAGRLAYAARAAWLADPAVAEVPVERLLSAEYADKLRAQIQPGRAMATLPPSPVPEHADTVYLTVVDKDLNAVSFINSLYHGFGSGYMAPKTGVMLQNRGQSFSVDPMQANCIAPGKRPMHTLVPGMVLKNGETVMPFGVMGGYYQAMGHAFLLGNLFDFGLDLQEAIDLPRLFTKPDGPVETESGIPAEAIDGLKRRGHKVARAPKPVGGAQAIWIDRAEGVLTGGSEPRKDGCAIGY